MELLDSCEVLKQDQQEKDFDIGVVNCNFEVTKPLGFFAIFSVCSNSTYENKYSPLRLHKDSSDLDRKVFILHFMQATIKPYFSQNYEHEHSHKSHLLTFENLLSDPELVSVDLSYGDYDCTFTPTEVLNCLDTANAYSHTPSWRSVHGSTD